VHLPLVVDAWSRRVYGRAIKRLVALAPITVVACLAAAITSMAADGSGQVSIGLVLPDAQISRTGDPFTYGAYRGLVRAKRVLHVNARTAVTSPTGPVLSPFSYLARQRPDLLIAVGTAETPGLSQAVRLFPHVRFAWLDAPRNEITGRPPPPENLEGTVFHTEQAAYLAGFVAAHMADRSRGPHVVSSVGGFPTPQVQAYIAGFQAGAKRADPKIKLLNTYSGDWLNQAKCAQVALHQIAQGSRVVFNVAGVCGIGALKAAIREHVYGVGVDTDQSNLSRRYILTSAVVNLNVAVYDLAKRLVREGLPTGGNLSFDLRDHGVGLGRFSPEVPLKLRHALIPLAAQIERGKIAVPMTLSRSH